VKKKLRKGHPEESSSAVRTVSRRIRNAVWKALFISRPGHSLLEGRDRGTRLVPRWIGALQVRWSSTDQASASGGPRWALFWRGCVYPTAPL